MIEPDILPVHIESYWDYTAQLLAIENGEACDHLFDFQEYIELDKYEDRRKYRDCHYDIRCHISFKEESKELKVQVKCHPSNPCLGSYYYCDQIFPNTEKMIEDIFWDNYEVMNGCQ